MNERDKAEEELTKYSAENWIIIPQPKFMTSSCLQRCHCMFIISKDISIYFPFCILPIPNPWYTTLPNCAIHISFLKQVCAWQKRADFTDNQTLHGRNIQGLKMKKREKEEGKGGVKRKDRQVGHTMNILYFLRALLWKFAYFRMLLLLLLLNRFSHVRLCATP